MSKISERFTLIFWFACLTLSFFIKKLGYAEQGKAFWVVYLCGYIAFTIRLIILFISFGNSLIERITAAVYTAFIYIAVILTIMLITYLASLLFNVNFYIELQIITFFQCLFGYRYQKQPTKRNLF